MFEESASALPSSVWTLMNSWFTPTVLFVLLNVMIGTIALTSALANQKKPPQNQQQTYSHNEPHPKIATSSTVLQRLKSFNFYPHRTSQDPQNLAVHHQQPNPGSGSLFSLEHNHQALNLETQALYFFQENFPETLETSQSQAGYIFEQNGQESQTHFVFDQKDSNLEDFQRPHEENVEGNELQSMDEVYSQLTSSYLSRTTSDTEPASGKIPSKLPARMRKSASLTSPFGRFEKEDIVEMRRPATVRERGNAKAADGDEEVDAKADDFINRFKQQLKLQRLDSTVRYKDRQGGRRIEGTG